MTKAEILEAINATIAPNGVKGITAESLANILTEIVNAAGEGGAGGEYLDMTPANPDDLESEELSEEAKAHNAALYTKICEVLNNGGVLPPVSVNESIMGMYASSVAFEEDLLMFYFHGPIANEPSNFIVSATTIEHAPSALVMGGDLTLMILYLQPTGEVIVEVPGL
jgi:hypothetical protein